MRPRTAAVLLLALAVLLLAACSTAEPTTRPPATAHPTATAGPATRPPVTAPPTALLAVTAGPGRMSARYDTFTGVQRRHPPLRLGELLVLDYEAGVQRGSLALRVLDPEQEVLWQVVLVADGSDHIELVCILAGTYSIVVEGDDTAGSFDVRWQVH